MIVTLYKTTLITDGRFYIGVHETDDPGFGTETSIDSYAGSGDHIEAALTKYGRDAFAVEVVAYFDDAYSAYSAEADIVTQEWLDMMGGYVFNKTVGGNMPPRVTRWFNDGITNRRLIEGQIIPEGYIPGRIMKNDGHRVESVRRVLKERNVQSNPMKNSTSREKMTNTIRTQYRNGRVPHNKGKKNDSGAYSTSPG